MILTPHYPSPRGVPCLNYSQLVTFERSPEEYLKTYVYGAKKRISRNIALGAAMARGLEDEEATGDPLLDLIMARLPKFELMDVPLEADLEDKRETIHLIAKPDSAKRDYTAFLEYKTSTRRWTKRMVDESGQITFYATVMWLATYQIPQDIELMNAGTKYLEDGSLTVTGEIYRFPTTRTLADIIKMTKRMRDAWFGIKELVKSELL